MSPDMLGQIVSVLVAVGGAAIALARFAAIAAVLKHTVESATKEIVSLQDRIKAITRDVDTIPTLRKDVDDLRAEVARNKETAIERFVRLETRLEDQK